MRVDIYIFDQYIKEGKLMHKLQPRCLGYVITERFIEDEIFNLCNWSHWTKEKPSNLYANIGSCGHGLYLINPETNKGYLALSFGWLTGNRDEILKYVQENQSNPLWQ